MNAPDTNHGAKPSPHAGEGRGEAAMLDTVERLGLWRTQGIYDIGEAYRLTGVSANSIKRWLQDYSNYIADLKPPWKDMTGHLHTQHNRLSFLELIEVLVAGKIRVGQGGGYKEVRKYHGSLAAEWGMQFPFAHQNLLTHKERLPEPVVKTLGQLDYEDDFAARWYPLGKDGHIVSEPRISGGAPTIKGRRVRVEDIKGQFKAGASINFISRDFELELSQVEAALRYAFLTAA